MNYRMEPNQSSADTSYKSYGDMMSIVNAKLRNSMVWMMVGVLTTFATIIMLMINNSWFSLAMNHYKLIMFVEIAVVFVFSMRQMTASLSMLKIMFFSYSILTGLTLSVLTAAYGSTAFINAFLGTVAFFTAFAFIGKVTKRNLSSLQPYLLAGVIGLIVISLVNMFFGLGISNGVISGLGLIVFAGFTAFDVNIIKRRIIVALSRDPSLLERIELVGALSLYLDFINIFLYMLRLNRD